MHIFSCNRITSSLPEIYSESPQTAPLDFVKVFHHACLCYTVGIMNVVTKSFICTFLKHLIMAGNDNVVASYNH